MAQSLLGGVGALILGADSSLQVIDLALQVANQVDGLVVELGEGSDQVCL